ncbi:MAG: diguanylate cyclase [Lachnospiraceae bacterium]|nr:diguanylate cyclase [Lachnospiraceae bacterium]
MDLKNLMMSSGIRLNVTISVGCCHGRCRNDQDMRHMMNKADKLLYSVKNNGKNGLKIQMEDN